MKRWLMRLAATLCRPRWLATLVGACLAAAVGGYFFWTVRATDDLRRQALAAMDDRDFERAKTNLQAYVAARPSDGEARFLLARAYRRARVEDLDQAHLNLDEARHLRFSGADLELETALLDVQETGSPVKRADAFRQALDSKGPRQLLALDALARGCIAQNRLAEANGWLNQWVDHAPDDWYPRLWRGALFEYMNLASLAAADFEFVLEKKPGDEEIRVRVGLMLSRSGLDCNTALNYLEPYSRAHPQDVDVVVAMARCRRILDQTAEAEALLKPVVAAHPDAIDALLTLALVESDRGDDLGALEHLRRLDPLVRQSHAPSLLGRLRRLEPVLNHVDAPDRKQMVFSLSATILARLGRTEESRHYLAEADQIGQLMDELTQAAKEYHQTPQDAAALAKVGMLYLRIGMWEEGVAVLQRVLQMKPDDLSAHRALAEFYESIDDPESRRLAEPHRRFVGPAAPPSSNLKGP